VLFEFQQLCCVYNFGIYRSKHGLKIKLLNNKNLHGFFEMA